MNDVLKDKIRELEIEKVVSKAEERFLASSEKAQKELRVLIKNLVDGMREHIESRDEGMRHLVSYLEQKNIESEDRESETKEAYVAIVTGLKGIARQLGTTQKVSVTNQYRRQSVTKAEMMDVMAVAIGAIEKIFVNQNEVASGGFIVKDAQNRVQEIREHFDGFTIRTIFTHDRSGFRWNTERVDD